MLSLCFFWVLHIEFSIEFWSLCCRYLKVFQFTKCLFFPFQRIFCLFINTVMSIILSSLVCFIMVSECPSIDLIPAVPAIFFMPHLSHHVCSLESLGLRNKGTTNVISFINWKNLIPICDYSVSLLFLLPWESLRYTIKHSFKYVAWSMQSQQTLFYHIFTYPTWYISRQHYILLFDVIFIGICKYVTCQKSLSVPHSLHRMVVRINKLRWVRAN